jgi:hypothetical protein
MGIPKLRDDVVLRFEDDVVNVEKNRLGKVGEYLAKLLKVYEHQLAVLLDLKISC